MRIVLDVSLYQISILTFLLRKELKDCERPERRTALSQPIGVHKDSIKYILNQLD